VTNFKWRETAELIGIGAIVASLIFVGLQMRQEHDIARAESLRDLTEKSIDYHVALAEYSDILVKGNTGAQLNEVEQHKLRTMMEAAENRVFLQGIATGLLGSSNLTDELKFASFLYRNPAARASWLQIKKDMENYVDPLRTPASLERSRKGGSSAFRKRIEAYLAKLEDLDR